MTKSRIRSYHPAYLTPSPSPSPSPSPRDSRTEPPPQQVSDGHCQSYAMSASRPVSLAPSLGLRLPNLHEILTDSAPQPYTLGAFMAYLSQNHCLETLEFTMEADRYRLAYSQSQHNFLDYGDHVCGLWQKLIQAYIQPYGSREVNLPAHVRDHLLSLPCGPPPPDPSELAEAVRIIYELMSDSVLVPFVESFNTHLLNNPPSDDKPAETRHGRSRSRSSKDYTTKNETSRSPRTSFLPHLSINMSRRNDISNQSNPSTSESGDREDAPDDGSTANSPTSMDLMTPPTTPPTHEWAFSSPPGSIHKAISAHSNGWKKVGAKLGLGRRARSTHRATTSSATSAARSAAPVHQSL